MRKIISLIIISMLISCSEEIEKISSEDLAKKLTIVDMHIDTPYRLWRQNLNGDEIDDISKRTLKGDFDYPRAVSGGLNVPFFSIYTPASTQIDSTSHEMAVSLISMIEDIVTLHSDKFFIVKSTSDIELLDRERLGIAFGMENGAPIEGDLSRVQFYHDKGIRYITLTHSKSNHISDSSYDENHQWEGGLSSFGKELIREMNKVGIMVDISHVSDKAFYESIEISEVPVIASHSSLRHFTPGFERNVSDDMLIKLASKGGVISINFGSSFLTKKALEYRRNREGPYPFADVTDVVDHIDRVVNLVGIDHVGIGSDYDGVGDTLPSNLKDVSTFPNLISELLTRGYTEEDIEKILSGNIIRVWKEVEDFANGRKPV
ncbi:MAG: dipeptidase [Pseudomonadota bacterium]|nr:dipeptidase [Pseudomonadota bacterium]|tara:strand:+ start:190 stop:1317 length:1128 start_codon:yes stop_codon:yes gene_type:complete